MDIFCNWLHFDHFEYAIIYDIGFNSVSKSFLAENAEQLVNFSAKQRMSGACATMLTLWPVSVKQDFVKHRSLLTEDVCI